MVSVTGQEGAKGLEALAGVASSKEMEKFKKFSLLWENEHYFDQDFGWFDSDG